MPPFVFGYRFCARIFKRMGCGPQFLEARWSISCPARGAVSATYRTNLNHAGHSKLSALRPTLKMLWFLRAPLMLRPVLIAGWLILFVATSAVAARTNPIRKAAHATAAGTAHRSRPAAKTSAKSARRKAAQVAKSTSQKVTPRRSTRSRASARRTALPGRHLRRAQYSRRSRARLVPIAAVPIRHRTTQSDYSGNEPVSDAGSGPTTVVVPVKDSAAVASVGNPLADPPAVTSVAPAVGQIASLNVPRVYGRYALRGTRDSLVRQNERVELESLERIEDSIDLQNRIASGSLVRVPETSALMVNPGIPEERRYCRQWTADFLGDLSRAHEAQFHKPLIVSSAVRTVEYQKRLMRVNRNAADAEGDIVSPHLTGATIDIAKSGLSRREMQWMRDHLFAYQTAGVIDVEEEFRQRCFHITVYRNYSPASSPSGPHHTPVPQTVPPDPSTATVSDDAATSDK